PRRRTAERPISRALDAAASSPIALVAITRTTSRGDPRIVGPEPITPGRSPGTSEIASVTRVAFVRLPRRPPLTAERGVRTRLISTIEAPDRVTRRTLLFFSARVMPGRGKQRSADVPPEIRQRIASLASNRSKNRIARRAAVVLDLSGSGCDAKRTSAPPSSGAG